MPRSVDNAIEAPVGWAVLIDVVLVTLFAVQHSVMARPAFKKWWTRIVPEPIERSTYVLLASLVLALMFWQWRRATRRCLGGDVAARASCAVDDVLAGLGDRAGVDIHDQSLRVVRAEAGVRGVAGAAGCRDRLPGDAALPGGAPPADAGLHRRLLGLPDHDGGSLTVRNRDDRIHPGRPAAGGARPDGGAGHALRRIPAAGSHADPGPTQARHDIEADIMVG